MMDTHPAAELFPMMPPEDLQALADDIAANGQRESIKTLDGLILDGRNRHAACLLAGVDPEFESVEVDALAYVISLNVKRRNLSKQQTAIAAAEAWEMATGTKEDARAKKLARLFNVNHAYVSMARALVVKAPTVAAEVKAGRADLAAAYEQIQAVEQRRERAERELRERERELDELRRDVEAMAERGIEPGLLAPPPPEQIRQEADLERLARNALGPESAGPAAASETYEAWMRLLREADTLAHRPLPDEFPDDDEIGALRLSALDVAARLADMAARIVAMLPPQEKPLRRVK